MTKQDLHNQPVPTLGILSQMEMAGFKTARAKLKRFSSAHVPEYEGFEPANPASYGEEPINQVMKFVA